jgi:hypothetical protein
MSASGMRCCSYCVVKETRVSVTGAAAVNVAGEMGAEEKEDIFVVWCWCDVGSVGRKRCGEGEGLWGYLWAVEVWVGDGSGLKGIVGLLVLFSGVFLVFEMLLPVYCVLANEWMVEF